MKKGNFLTHKFLPILFTFIFISFIFISNQCFAFSFSYDNTYYDLGDLPFDTSKHQDFLILKFTNGSGYQVLFPQTDYDLPFYRTGGDGIQYYIKGTTTYGQWNYYNYTISSDSWSEMKTTSQREAKIYSNGSHVSDVIYCTHDVILKSDNSIFFQKTPVTEVTIPALETAQEIPMAMGTALKLIIPIGLIVLLTVLLISLIKSVILRMK